MKFTELQQEILKLAKRKDACKDEYKKASICKNKNELLIIIKENFAWCYQENVITIDLLDEFGEKILIKNGIYHKGIVDKIQGEKDIILCGDVEIKMLDSSQVGEMWDSSQVGKMLDSSQIGKMWGSSIIRTWNGKHPKILKEKAVIIDYKNHTVIYTKEFKKGKL